MSEASAEKTVQPGWWVKIAGFEQDQPDEEETYWIVEGPHADLTANQIRADSALAQALVGNRVGQTLPYRSPTGVFHLKIVDAGSAD